LKTFVNISGIAKTSKHKKNAQMANKTLNMGAKRVKEKPKTCTVRTKNSGQFQNSNEKQQVPSWFVRSNLLKLKRTSPRFVQSGP
jgi:hypothetical protein